MSLVALLFHAALKSLSQEGHLGGWDHEALERHQAHAHQEPGSGLGKEKTNSWKGGDPDRGWRSEEWVSGWSEEQGEKLCVRQLGLGWLEIEAR